MSLIIHQFKKDIYHTRYLLGLWVACALALVLANGFLISFSTHHPELNLGGLFAWRFLSGALTWTNMLFVAFLIPMVVHQEPLTGTAPTFWITRPITRSTLLASKALYFLLAFALMFLSGQCSFFIHGNQFHFAGPDVAGTLGCLAWVLTVAGLAALTSSFLRFGLFAAAAGVLWALSESSLFLAFLVRNALVNPALRDPALLPSELDRKLGGLVHAPAFDPALLITPMTIAFAATVVALVYLSGRVKLGIGIAVAGIILNRLAYVYLTVPLS